MQIYANIRSVLLGLRSDGNEKRREEIYSFQRYSFPFEDNRAS